MDGKRDSETKARLLQVAREVFSELGPEHGTIRKICTSARLNVAAVNYHFGSKERLYLAVISDYLEQKQQLFPHNREAAPDAPPEERLRSFVRSLLSQFLNEADLTSQRLGRLVTHEFIEPSSEQCRKILERHCRPSHAMLLEILRAMLPGVDAATVSRCAVSIVGQCLLTGFAGSSMSVLDPALAFNSGDLDAIVGFILEFSLGGIVRLGAGGGNMKGC